MKRYILLALVIVVTVAFASVSAMSVSAASPLGRYYDQDGNKYWCNTDSYGCWVTGENGEHDYIMFWSEASRDAIMGPDSNAPIGIVYNSSEMPLMAPPTAIPTQSAPVIVSPTATVIPTATATVIPTATATVIPTATATVIPTATATVIPTATATVIPTATAEANTCPTKTQCEQLATIGTEGVIWDPKDCECYVDGDKYITIYIDCNLYNGEFIPGPQDNSGWCNYPKN